MIVEVKFSDRNAYIQEAIQRVSHFMASVGCSVGLVVSGERVMLLRDSFEKPNGESIHVAGEAKLPSSLLPTSSRHWQTEHEFIPHVQQWLESLKLASSVEDLPDDLRKLLGEPTISLIQLGEVRAAGPRWSALKK